MRASFAAVFVAVTLATVLPSTASARRVVVVRPRPAVRPAVRPFRNPNWTPVKYDRVKGDLNDLSKAIDKADKAGSISKREAADLHSRVDDTRDELKRFNSNGLTQAEVAQLEGRINYIRRRLGLEQLDYNSHPG